MSKQKFLPNDKNKERLINMLCVKLQEEVFIVEQAEENADYLIIKSAFEIEKGSQCVVVNGEDIDLLFIMAASTNSEKVFFLNPLRGKAEDALYCSVNLNIAPHKRRNNLFLHEFIVCDNVSPLFRQGKKNFFNILNNTEH
ncbi:hypothetical protein AVEN_223702-1 [Araneus ventricosus]|uniref:Uncharacterized protein n=1 Tax=Araneus ventricosus TaxID=182803 RepID=A0A4Y2KLQ5_ARAVE|nr:hypothetical protein AVEN_223702-1 [Araneus ventricosus]